MGKDMHDLHGQIETLQRSLAASEARFRNVIEKHADGIVIVGLGGQIQFVNPVAEALLGAPASELIGAFFGFPVVVGESTEVDLLPRDGITRVAEMRVVETEWEGAPAYLASLRDITDRKRAEEAQSLLASIVASSNDAIIGKTLDGTIVSWNAGAERMYGYTAGEVIGRSISLLVPPDSPDDVSQILEEVRQGRHVDRYEASRLRKDGQKISVSLVVSPIYDADGMVIAASVIAHDITERKRMERALQESEMRFRLLAEHAQDLIYRYHLAPEPGFEYVSPSATKMTGYTPEEHYADPLLGFKLVHPDDRSLLERLRDAQVTSDAPLTLRWIRKDGSILWAEQRNTVIYDQDGNPVALDGIARDITERKQMEEALQRSEYRYRMLFNSTLDAIFIHDLSGHFLEVNEVACQRLGYSREELLQMGPLDIDAPEYAPLVETRIAHLHKYGHTVLETAHVCRDGTVIPIELGSRLIEYEGQAAILSIARDITDRKRAESEVRCRTAQLEALRTVGLGIATQLELDGLLRAIAGEAVELLEGNGGGLCLYREGLSALEVVVALGDGMLPPKTLVGYGEEVCGKIWEQGAPLILDASEVASLRPASAPGVLVTPGNCAAVGVPIRWGEKLLGTIVVYKNHQEAFSPPDARLLDLFATQAAIAIHNASLFESERDQRILAESLSDAAAAVSRTLDFDAVLDRILDQVERVVQGDAFLVLLREGDHLRVMRQRGHSALEKVVMEYLPERFPVGRFPALAEMLESCEPVVIPDTAANPLWVNYTGLVRSFVGTPVLIGDEIMGLVGVLSVAPGHFNDQDALRLRAFADHVAAAIRNAQLHQSLLDYAAQLESRVQARTAELEAQYSQSQAILRSVSGGIVVTDAEGKILQTNPTAQAWLTQLFSSEDAMLFRDAIRRLALDVAAMPEEMLALHGIDLKLRANPIVQQGAGEMAVVVAAHDITHLKALDRMKTRFITNISHEFRTPLSTIKLYTDLLQKQPAKVVTYLNALEQEVLHLSELIEDILEVSRIDAGQLELDLHLVSLQMLVESVVAERRPLAEGRSLEFTYVPAEADAEIFGDASLMSQALKRLINNAIYYTLPGGSVTVSTGQLEAEGRVWATVMVKDTGIGISEDELPHIFDRFFRGVEPRSMQISGTGLGLPLVAEIVGFHGGRVTVESTVPGKRSGTGGSTFTIWLPLERQDGVG